MIFLIVATGKNAEFYFFKTLVDNYFFDAENGSGYFGRFHSPCDARGHDYFYPAALQFSGSSGHLVFSDSRQMIFFLAGIYYFF